MISASSTAPGSRRGIRLLAAVAFVWFCVSGRWGWRSRSAAASGRLPELLPAS
jgi:hypothetical protein